MRTFLLPIPYKIPRNINPKSLGYILPDGSINFSNERAAYNYGKNKIVSALNSNEPREVHVVWADKRILKCNLGERNSVDVPLDTYPRVKNCVDMHGHPTYEENKKITYPFSPDDVCMLLKLNKVFGVKKSIIFNAEGENCTMKINRSPSFFDVLPTSLKTALIYKDSDLFKKVKILLTDFRLSNKAEKYVDTDTSGILQHQALQKCCPKLGIDYSTTFSNLRDI